MLTTLKQFCKKITRSKKISILVLGITALLLISAGLFTPSAKETTAAKKKLPIYCVDTQGKKQISISFDAAWGAEDTDTLLDILKKNDVKAAFFLCGYWVDKYPEEVKKIYNDGHDIGNHSNTHPHGSKLSLEENKENIQACHEKIKNLLGIDANLYRPPFGEYNDTVLDAAKACGYYPIQWDVDILDTRYTKNEHINMPILYVYSHYRLKFCQ